MLCSPRATMEVSKFLLRLLYFPDGDSKGMYAFGKR